MLPLRLARNPVDETPGSDEAERLTMRVEELAAERGLKVVDRGNGHLQITGGPMMVNYYPDSKRKSAYVSGTTTRRIGVSAKMAIDMAFVPPKIAQKAQKDTQRGHYRSVRRKMLAKSNKCHWCPTILTLDASTVDHVIPLHRGGLDNANNRVLACEPCNNRRGHDMPELREKL